MARTVAGSGGRVYTAGDILDNLVALGFPYDRAVRIVAIADAFGVKAEALPDGLVTIRVATGGYRMEVQT